MNSNNFYYLQFLDDKRLRVEVDKVSFQAILEKNSNFSRLFSCEMCSKGISEFQTILSDDLPNKTLIHTYGSFTNKHI